MLRASEAKKQALLNNKEIVSGQITKLLCAAKAKIEETIRRGKCDVVIPVLGYEDDAIQNLYQELLERDYDVTRETKPGYDQLVVCWK